MLLKELNAVKTYEHQLHSECDWSPTQVARKQLRKLRAASAPEPRTDKGKTIISKIKCWLKNVFMIYVPELIQVKYLTQKCVGEMPTIFLILFVCNTRVLKCGKVQKYNCSSLIVLLFFENYGKIEVIVRIFRKCYLERCLNFMRYLLLPCS